MANGVQIYTPVGIVANADGLSARALLGNIRRHWPLVAGITLFFCLAGGVIGLGLPPHYQASGALVLYSHPPRVADVQEVLPDQTTLDPAAIRSEGDTLRSRSVIEQVVRELSLWRYPEFQSSALPGGWSWAAPATATADADTAPPTQAQIDTAIGKYEDHLVVGNDGLSMTMNVAFTAWRPELAAAIVNAHMQAYRDLEQQAKAEAAQRATAWLNAQIVKLRRKLRPAEAAVAAYRVHHHLTGTGDSHSALSAQLASLTQQLIMARANLAESEARAAQIQVRAAGKDAASGAEATNSPTVQELRVQEASLIEREASLSSQFGPAYPELSRVRSSLRDLRRQIAGETSRSYAAALEMVGRSRAREQSIERSVIELTERLNSSDAGLRELQENADSVRSLLSRFEKRMEETAAEPAFITSNSTIITRADAFAVARSSTSKFLMIGSGFVGFVLGALLSVLLELRDRTFRTSMEIEQHLEPGTVSATPRAIGQTDKSPADLILDDPRSVFAEAFRLSWTNIQLVIARSEAAGLVGGRPNTVIGITSAMTGEGKSTHALAFARTAALSGESVVLIDADLRRAGVSRLLDVEPGLTLRDFLCGQSPVSEVLCVEPHSGLYYMPSTPAGPLWSSSDYRRFGELIRHLREYFTIVIIDLPPVLGLAETIRLATATDGVALIIRWALTERQLVHLACTTLRNAGVTAMPVLNDVDLKTQRRYAHYDWTVVHTLYEKYYS